MTAPIDPGNTEALPPRDAKVLVTYWTLDCMLDWVFMHPDGSWNAEDHYDQLRDEMNADVVPPDYVVVRRDDLETALYGSQYWGEELRQDGEQEALDRLRALIGDE